MRLALSLALTAVLASAGCASERQQHRYRSYGNYYQTGYQHEQRSRPSGAPPVESASVAPTADEETEETGVVLTGGDETAGSSRISFAGGGAYGNADDYSWLVGYLHRVHMPDGRWKIRYAPLHQADAWGGSMVLAPDIRLDSYEEGDVVYVEGELLAERPSLYVAGALYRIREIRPYRPEPELALPAPEPVETGVTPAAYPEPIPDPVYEEDPTPVDPQYGPPIPDCHGSRAQHAAQRGYYPYRGHYYRAGYPTRRR